ncbi:MAG: hypothetical protein K5657_10245 [Desulfovibrio sp.]|nr:hypothetical protein [Desulfovibrio sp.]
MTFEQEQERHGTGWCTDVGRDVCVDFPDESGARKHLQGRLATGDGMRNANKVSGTTPSACMLLGVPICGA